MSDPAVGGYQCHGKLKPVTLQQLTGVASTFGTAAWVCRCGVWRHAYAPSESQLRALVEKHMPAYLAKRTK